MPYRLTLSPNLAVDDLPVHVAGERGYFAEAGLEVHMLPKDNADNGQPVIFDRQKERLFELGESDLYNACQWGCIIRIAGSARGATIIGKRASVIAMGLVVPPGSPVLTPEDLAGRAIAVSDKTGSYYVGYRMLDGFVPWDAIHLQHVGHPPERIAALFDGTVDAAILMEPYISLAEQRGARLVCQASYLGAEVSAGPVPADVVDQYHHALRRAVADINADLPGFAARLIAAEGLERELPAAALNLGRLLYVPPTLYTQADYQAAAGWMAARNLLPNPPAFRDAVLVH